MNANQHTLKESIHIEGVGLHTGQPAKMTLQAAAPGHGIQFRRTDLGEEAIVHADVDYVVDTSRGTTIAKGEARIHTTEHLLAALAGMQVDNVLIDIDGPEIPIMDGSSEPFIKAISQVGTEEQNALREYFQPSEGIFFKDEENGIEIAALPLNDYRLTVMVDYNSEVLGSQHASLNAIEEFPTEVASCRTFCFLHELEMLREQNLVQGGTLSNAIVIVDRKVEQSELEHLAELFNQPKVEVESQGILNNIQLRFQNEPARHKLLDLVGDLNLLGKPIKAQILAARPGHASNVAFAKKLKAKMLEMEKTKKNAEPTYNPAALPVMNVREIFEDLPHRFPFQLVDKIIHLSEDTVVGVKNVTINEPYFTGHFPGNPVMPGVLQLEAMAQNGGILVLNSVDNPKEWVPYFLGINNCRFRKPVVPGDTMIIKCGLLAPIRMGVAKMQGEIYVAGQVVADAVVSARIMRKDQI